MAYLIYSLQYNRTGFRKIASAMERFFVFDATMQGSKICIFEKSNGEHFATARVSIVESSDENRIGTLGFSPSWTDPDDGRKYPGCVEFVLPANASIISFLAESELGPTIQIGIEVPYQNGALTHIGPDDEGEYIWDLTIARGLSASLESCSRDCLAGGSE